MPDWVIGAAVNAILEVIRDTTKHPKWRKALLKLFREIAIQFQDDAQFEAAVKDLGF